MPSRETQDRDEEPAAPATQSRVEPEAGQGVTSQTWAQQPSARISPAVALSLQRVVGNDAVCRILTGNEDAPADRAQPPAAVGDRAPAESSPGEHGVVVRRLRQIGRPDASPTLRSSAPLVRRDKSNPRRARMWADRIQPLVPGLTPAAALFLCTALEATPLSVNDVQALAALVPAGWNQADVVTLGRKFVGGAGQLTLAQWIQIALGVPFHNQPTSVATWARTAGWTGPNLVALAQGFIANAAGLTATQWLAIARAQPAFINQAAVVAAWAQAGNGWNAANLVNLAGLCTGALTPTQWLAVATAHPGLANQEQAVAVFAQIANGWAPANIATLAGLFSAGPGGLTAADWALVANGPGLANQEQIVAVFAQMANGWVAANIATLAGLFAANAGGRTAQAWGAIAVSHATLANREADVAVFARIANGWTSANLALLAGMFGLGAGGRAATEWALLAGAHADVADQEAIVATLARTAWTAVDLTAFLTNLRAAGPAAAVFHTLFGIVGVAASTFAMLAPRWTAANLGTYIGGLLHAAVPAAEVATFVADPAAPAATFDMTAGGWAAASLAHFTAGALVAPASSPQNRLRGLLAHPLFPATSFALIGGPWTATSVGEFCGSALRTNVTFAGLQATIVAGGMPAALQGMTVPGGVTTNELGRYTGKARELGVTVPWLLALKQVPTFPASARAMLNTGWTEEQFAEFTSGAFTTNVPAADLADVLAQAGVPNSCNQWQGVGFTHPELGQIVGRARVVPTMTAVLLAPFLATGGAAAAAFALHAWGVLEIGHCIGHVLTRAGRPTDAEFVQILQICQTMVARGAPLNCTPLGLRNAAAGATCGAPAWAQVIMHAPIFRANWVGPRVHPNLPTVSWVGLGGGPAYTVELTLYGARITHVEDGHTYEYFLMTFANATRQGVGYGGHSSLFALGTNVTVAHLQPLLADGVVRGLAENAAWGANPTQGNTGGLRVGVLRDGAPAPPRYPTYISQCYPTAGINLVGRDAVAIGRLMGRF